jgi:hypothetical protein
MMIDYKQKEYDRGIYLKRIAILGDLNTHYFIPIPPPAEERIRRLT